MKHKINTTICEDIYIVKKEENVSSVPEWIKKMVPKKPRKIAEEIKDFFDFRCPICGNKIVFKADGDWLTGRPLKYCNECGQALDWSGDGE